MESYISMEMEMSTSVKKGRNVSNEGGAPAIVAPSESSMRQILRNATVQLMAVYILVYVGVEVTIGGESREARYEYD
jgi:fucose permease